MAIMQLDYDGNLSIAPCKNAQHQLMTLSFSCDCMLGVNPHERITRQQVIITLAICTNDIATINNDYELIINNIIFRYASTQAPGLLEHMAYELGREILATIDTLVALTLVIKKPEAIACAKNSFICMRMRKPTASCIS